MTPVTPILSRVRSCAPPRLSQAVLDLASAEVLQPGYDRARVTPGVVHFGPGAFHRAHQAFYVDQLLGEDPSLGIIAVSLRSEELRDALTPQDGLYVLAEIDTATRYRIIGAVQKVLVAPESPEAVLNHLAAPGTRLVSATVTEKGYCFNAAGELDLAHPEIANDLRHPSKPVSLIGYLVAGLQLRRERALTPFTTLSCDNLSNNGRRLKRAVMQFAAERDAGLARWIDSEARFPCTMVDSITPATSSELKTDVARVTGLRDEWPVQRERFTQFVIEDDLGPGPPNWADAGVIVTRHVAGYEEAKLRLLNGAHSSLAYLGLLRGHETVREAMGDRELVRFIAALMREDIAPTLPACDFVVEDYIAGILERFRNPALVHRLAQIAWDGSQKLPYRILATVQLRLDRGWSLGRLGVPIAGWMAFVVDQVRRGIEIVDPRVEELIACARRTGGDAAGDTDLFLSLRSVFAEPVARHPEFRQAVATAYAHLNSPRAIGALRGLDSL